MRGAVDAAPDCMAAAGGSEELRRGAYNQE